MNLTTAQVSTKLGISASAVRGLVKGKRLVDQRASQNGRHSMMFNSKEVAELAKTYKKRSHFTSPPSTPTTPGFILRRLEAIEGKLDTLIRMWQ